MLNQANSNFHQQETELNIIENLIPYLKTKNFLDIGAEKGTISLFFHVQGLSGIFFEPLPRFAPELTALAENTGCVFLPYAIDSEDRTADFFAAYDHEENVAEHFSSLHQLEKDERILHKKVATVTCRSLNSLLAEGLIPKEVGVLKIDTEGNDLQVLKGMSEINAEVLLCEYFMPGIYSGWEQGSPFEIIEQANRLGFKHSIAIKRIDEYEFISIDSNAFIDKQWGNLIFMKEHIFDAAKKSLKEIMKNGELLFFKKIAISMQNLKDICEERLACINVLQKTCEDRHSVIEILDQEVKRLRGNILEKNIG